jgi:hypothetical protein
MFVLDCVRSAGDYQRDGLSKHRSQHRYLSTLLLESSIPAQIDELQRFVWPAGATARCPTVSDGRKRITINGRSFSNSLTPPIEVSTWSFALV